MAKRVTVIIPASTHVFKIKTKQNEKAIKPVPPSCGKTQPEQKNDFKSAAI
jgi:hypothetical protein